MRRTLSGVYTGPEEFSHITSSNLKLPGRLPPRAPTRHLCQGYRCRTSTSLAGKPPCCYTEDTWHGGFLQHWPTWGSGTSEIVLLRWKTNLTTQSRWNQALQHGVQMLSSPPGCKGTFSKQTPHWLYLCPVPFPSGAQQILGTC